MNLEKCKTIPLEKIYIKSEKYVLPEMQVDKYKSTNEMRTCDSNEIKIENDVNVEAYFHSQIMEINEPEDRSNYNDILFKSEDGVEFYTSEDNQDPLMVQKDSDIKQEIEEQSKPPPSTTTTSNFTKKKDPCRTCILQAAKRAITNILPNVEKQNCEFCSFLANENQTYKIHFAADTGKTSFSCSICSYKTHQKSSIKKHSMIHTGEKPFSCELCSFKAGQKSTIKTHMLTHTGKDSYACSLCPYKGKLKSRLKRHCLIHTKKSNRKDISEKTDVTQILNCKLCSFTTSEESVLKNHILTHTEEKLFMCELCPYKSAKRFKLRMHYMTHEKDKPFTCDICPYKTDKKGILNKHIASHVRKQLLPCQFCSYTGTKKNLDIHLLLHTDKKLFSRSLPSLQKEC